MSERRILARQAYNIAYIYAMRSMILRIFEIEDIFDLCVVVVVIVVVEFISAVWLLVCLAVMFVNASVRAICARLSSFRWVLHYARTRT